MPNITIIQGVLPLIFIELVECAQTKDHHLKKSEGHPYQLRVTIDQGPKFVGKRITIPLSTRDYKEALRLRDHLLHALKSADFLTKDAKVRIGSSDGTNQ